MGIPLLTLCRASVSPLHHNAVDIHHFDPTINPHAAREHVVELAGGFGLHGREDVRVGVERDADLGVAEPLLNDLGMDALREQSSASSSVADVCRLVPQAVEPALGKGRREGSLSSMTRPSLERLGYHRSSLRDLAGTIMVSNWRRRLSSDACGNPATFLSEPVAQSCLKRSG